MPTTRPWDRCLQDLERREQDDANQRLIDAMRSPDGRSETQRVRDLLARLGSDPAVPEPVPWRRATGDDVPAMVTLTQTHFEWEGDTIWRTDPLVLQHNILRAVVDQFYDPASCLVVTNERAWFWVARGERVVWSRDEMAAVKMAHVAMSLGARERVNLTREMIAMWQSWCLAYHIPVIVSSTMRTDQAGFLRLHEQAGWQRRGSVCYLRLEPGVRDESTSDGEQDTDHADL